jgi:hypothetical protein
MGKNLGETFYIVTPSYNATEYIDETILSVVSQSGNFSIHYHIQDGGSEDGTVEKLKEWERRIASGIERVFCRELIFTWCSEKDEGMYDAINKGFCKLAPKDKSIMAWVNTDDPYFPFAFSTVARAFSDIPDMEWFGGATAILYDNSTLFFTDYDQPYPCELIRAYCCDDVHWRVLQQNGMFWKGTLWKKAGPADARLRFAGDFALWPRFAEHADFWHASCVLGLFRVRDGQLSKNALYGYETEQVRPLSIREKDAREFFKKKKGRLIVPALLLKKDGHFMRCRQVTNPIKCSTLSGRLKKWVRQVLPIPLLAIIRRIRRSLGGFFN